MENNEMHDAWVDRRLEALDPPRAWQPDATAGLARFQQRRKAYRVRRTRWTWAAIAASVTGIGMFLLVPAPCSGAGCNKPAGVSQPPAPPVLIAQAGKPEPKMPKPAAPAVKPKPPLNYKESGSVLAPITCELFTDYECPHCAVVFLEAVPRLTADYVRTGKVRLIHRDYPLPQHQYARLAARYANAAGTLGHYDAVVTQIFRTQAIWDKTGDIGTQVAHVLPPDVMEKVRALVQNDAHLDDGVAADVAIGQRAGLNQTPTMLVVYKGKTQLLAPIPQYELLKSYFDELLAK